MIGSVLTGVATPSCRHGGHVRHVCIDLGHFSLLCIRGREEFLSNATLFNHTYCHLFCHALKTKVQNFLASWQYKILNSFYYDKWCTQKQQVLIDTYNLFSEIPRFLEYLYSRYMWFNIENIRKVYIVYLFEALILLSRSIILYCFVCLWIRTKS